MTPAIIKITPISTAEIFIFFILPSPYMLAINYYILYGKKKPRAEIHLPTVHLPKETGHDPVRQIIALKL
jgi:hypothetical protein